MRASAFMLCLVALLTYTYASAPANPGDLNADLRVNLVDVALVQGQLGLPSLSDPRADPNNDNAANIFDIILVAKYWGMDYSVPPPGETCGNGFCNASVGETCTTCSLDCGACPPNNPHPNEPVGMLPYADLSFGGPTSSWVTAGNTAFVMGDTYAPPTTALGNQLPGPGPGPESPSGIWQIKMPYHMTSGRGTGSGHVGGAPQAKSLYMSGWFQVSSNWYGENTQPPGTGVIKMIMPLTQSTSWSAVANRLIISAAHGSGTNALFSKVAFQQVVSVNGNTGISTSYFSPRAGTGGVQRGTWHHVEFVTVANTPGNADGRFQMWLDGKETHNIPNIQYDPSADIKYNTIDLNSVYGGPTNVNATPEEQYIWWDHVYASYSTAQK